MALVKVTIVQLVLMDIIKVLAFLNAISVISIAKTVVSISVTLARMIVVMDVDMKRVMVGVVLWNTVRTVHLITIWVVVLDVIAVIILTAYVLRNIHVRDVFLVHTASATIAKMIVLLGV